MMKRQILKTVVFAVVSLILFNACSKEPENYPENLIEGTWRVTSKSITINTPENEHNRLLIQSINDHPCAYGGHLNVGSVWVFYKSLLTWSYKYEPCSYLFSSDGSLKSIDYKFFESWSGNSTYEVSDDVLRLFDYSGIVVDRYDIEELSRNKLVLVHKYNKFPDRACKVNYTVRAVFEKA